MTSYYTHTAAAAASKLVMYYFAVFYSRIAYNIRIIIGRSSNIVCMYSMGNILLLLIRTYFLLFLSIEHKYVYSIICLWVVRGADDYYNNNNNCINKFIFLLCGFNFFLFLLTPSKSCYENERVRKNSAKLRKEGRKEGCLNILHLSVCMNMMLYYFMVDRAWNSGCICHMMTYNASQGLGNMAGKNQHCTQLCMNDDYAWHDHPL